MLRATASASSSTRSALRRHPSPLLMQSSSGKALSTAARLLSTARRRPLLAATRHAAFASAVSTRHRPALSCECRRTYASGVAETETHKSREEHHILTHSAVATGGKGIRTATAKNAVRKSAVAGNASNAGSATKATARHTTLDQSSQASPATATTENVRADTTTQGSSPSTVAATGTPSSSTSASASRLSDSNSAYSPARTNHTPQDPGPPEPKKNPTIKERIVGIYHQVKFLFRFYLNGVKQIWRDRSRVKEIKELCDRQGRLPNWSETRLMMTHRSDMKKLPLFLAILIIIEEILPLVVIYAPFLLPSTCVLPTQLEKIRKAEELKRASAIERLRRSASVQQLLDVAGIPLKGSDRLTEVPKLSAQRAQEVARRWEALDRKTIVDFSHIFALSTWLRPASVMRKNLEKHIAFLQQDDHILRGRPIDAADSAAQTEHSAGPDYSELPQASPILMEIASERGLRASEIGEGEMFDSLRRWLILTPPFAPCDPAEAAATTGAAATAATEREDVDVSGFPASPAPAPSATSLSTTSAVPEKAQTSAELEQPTLSNPLVQLLLLPISLYPPPSLFTPSLDPAVAASASASASASKSPSSASQSQPREQQAQAQGEGGLIDRAKEVVDQVVEVQEATTRREEAIRKAEEEKAERERVEAQAQKRR